MPRKMARTPTTTPIATRSRSRAAVKSRLPEPVTAAPATVADALLSENPAPFTKIAMVLDLLRRSQGATLAELVQATGWLPHTTRAALTGLRKKGHVIEKTKRDDATCYRIVEAG